MIESGKVADLSEGVQSLVQEAMKLRKQAYAPYSKFLVGCALESTGGKRYSGCNVENVGLTLTVHAEIHALCNLRAGGERECQTLVVVTPLMEPLFPCGQCRQFISELGPKCEVYAVDAGGKEYKKASITELLPEVYEKDHQSLGSQSVEI